MKELFALMILRVIQLRFGSQIGKNPIYISLENEKGNTIYIEQQENNILVSVYKVSSRCYVKEVRSIEDIELVAEQIKEKLKLIDDNKEQL